MWVLFLSGIFPFLLSFWPGLGFWRNWRALVKTTTIILLGFGIWDVGATWRGHWFFDPASVGNIYIVNVPLEEALFFIVIPFCCVFTWETVNYFWKK
ncbi:MAG: lycopene cyclase domain-containing protein [Candidatus Omnitrophica bacterium]|nr:lycopene cyclase domain-containing protein [Candidatus Omnitrophota bacterium]